MSTNTICQFKKISDIENELIEMDVSNFDKCLKFDVLFSKMKTLTRIAVNAREASVSPWCEKMVELEKLYGFHKRVKNFGF